MTTDELHTLAHQIAYSCARSDIECFTSVVDDRGTAPTEPSRFAPEHLWYDLSTVIRDEFERKAVADAHRRTRAKFGRQTQSSHGSWKIREGLTIAQAVQRVRDELGRMGIRDDDLVISTNLDLRLDGLPRSNQREPSDPGVSVYWTQQRGAAPRCMAIDRYDRVADNLAAIAATLDAMRAIERHGGAEILNRAFTGFTAIEHQASKPWHVVLGVPSYAPTDEVRIAYRRARAATHPDRDGGDAELFGAVQAAWATFCKERGINE